MPDIDYSWPPMEKRKAIGTRPKRLDGPMKSTGRAKYASDTKVPGLLQAVYVSCPHAHAKVTNVDTSEAEKMPGVKAVEVMADKGTEIRWQGWEVAAVAATTVDQARDAARRIKVEYEVMPHLVREEDPAKAGTNARQGQEQKQGDPDKAFQEAQAVSEGQYNFAVATHCCLEPHGQIVQWQGENASVWPSTQDVTDYAGSLAQSIKIPAANINVAMDYVGGGFGSKFGPDAWATVAANLSKKAGGRPVRLFLERDMEQMIAGNRPSVFAKIKVAGNKDGTVTAMDFLSWGTGGFQAGGPPIQPYVFVNIPNYRKSHIGVSVNAGASRAWRAPGNQAASYLTCSAYEDFAAKIGMDPIAVFKKNVNYAQPALQARYNFQLDKAAELAEWKKLWHPRGQGGGAGPVKRGLGVAVGTWSGMGHASQCRTTIHPDGSVLVEIGTQDLGTGTRTVITQVAAESLGLPMEQVKLEIGRSTQPRDGASGGSSTVGGVCTSTRKSTVNAVNKLYEAVAPSLGVPADQLEAVDGKIQVKGTPAKSLAWKDACRKLGTNSISEMGTFSGRDGGNLLTSGAAGAQIADVSVDTETGIVKINRYVAVQDCGTVINPRLAESQVYGAIIMGIGTALFEERIMDEQTGHMLNADMEYYKLAGIGDVGDIVVHMDIRPENDQRGVVGLGEPPAIPICAAVGNAVANAVGVRVPYIPLTPDRVLNTLEGRKA